MFKTQKKPYDFQELPADLDNAIQGVGLYSVEDVKAALEKLVLAAEKN